MKVKVAFIFFLVVLTSLTYFFPINTGFEAEKDAFDMVEKNGVTAMYDFFNFFDTTKKHEIEIVVSKTELDLLDEKMEDLYNEFGLYRSSYNVKADFIYREEDEVKYTLNNIGIRTNGNGKKLGLINYEDGMINLNNFKLSFDETFDLSQYSEYKDRTFLGMTNLNLKFNKTSTKETDEVSSYINEVYAYQLYNQVGVIAPYASNVHLILNVDGDKINMGVYCMIENIDKAFLKKRFSKKANDGNLYKCLYRQKIYANLTLDSINAIGIKNEEENYYPTYDIKTNKKTNDGSDLIDFITKINDYSGKKLKSYLDTKVNIENFLKYNAISYILGSLDDFRYRGNNYYLYFNSKNHQVYFIPQDLDYILGQYGDLSYYQEEFASIDPYSTWTLMGQKNTLLSKTLLLLEDSHFNDYRKDYEDYINLYSDLFFTYDLYSDLYYTTRDLYSSYVTTTQVRTKTPDFGIPTVTKNFIKLKKKTISEVIG
jgi:spore coat protein CotH